MVAYLKVGPEVTTYSDYLRATREAEKEDLIELTWSSRTQAADGPPNWGLLASSPWENLRVTIHFWKSLQSTWHIWKKRMWVMVKTQSVMTLVELRGWPRSLWSNWQGQWKILKQMRNAVTIAATLNISSVIAWLVKTSRDKKQLKGQEGDSINEGSPDPSCNNECHKEPPDWVLRGIKPPLRLPSWIQTLISNGTGWKT